MSNSDIRVVPGPANYFSHPGSLARLHDFYSAEQLPRALWIYGERAIAGAEPFTRGLQRARRQKSSLRATAAKATSPGWSTMRVKTAPW